MNPATAKRIERHGWRLLRMRAIKPRDQTVLMWMLWHSRAPGRWECAPAYQAIANATGICRDQAIKAVAALVALGIITKTKRHVLIRWGRNRAQVAARQISNSYVFAAPIIESSPRAADSDSLLDRGSKALEAALAGLGRAMGAGTAGPSGRQVWMASWPSQSRPSAS